MKNWKSKYLQLLFVFAAFALMAGAAYFFNSNMLRNHLMNGAQELLLSAEANVKAALSESEITLLNSHHILQGMMDQDASKQEILDYLITTTEWMRNRDAGLVAFYGIYAFIYGEFVDSLGMNPGEDYIPQTRPWYQTAIRSGNNVAYTTPYIDWHTGDTIVSAVRNIFINDTMVGILVVDINISWLIDYIGSLSLAADGFGMLLSQNLTFMAFQDESYLGRQLQDLGGAYEDLARSLRAGNDVFAERIYDHDRGHLIVFIKHIFNDWYVGIVTPSSQFFRDLQASAFVLVILGLLLSITLCFILLRLSAAKERSDEESLAKSTFLAQMSHEIRTPLNAVIGLSEIVLNRGKLPDESRYDIQQVHQSGSSLLGIINDILDISKIEAGGFELIPDEYDTASFINDTVNLNKVRIGSKPISFKLEIGGDFPSRLMGDELRVKQILNNILSNAIKYTREGEIILKAESDRKTNSLQNNILIKFIVSDTGIGIKAEDFGKLFSEYTQLDAQSNRRIEGTGLGLAISRKLAGMMEGSISAESEYGKGSVFTISIIQGRTGNECIGEETAKRLEQFNYISLHKSKDLERSWIPHGRVLVVDDLPVNLLVARGLLEPYGLTIDTADSGQRAIDMIQEKNDYDLVFMDHMMPEMDGIEAVSIIRKWEDEQLEKYSQETAKYSPKQLLERPKRIPIVALTANALAGNMEMFISKGFDGFLPKPIDLVQLDKILNQWIKVNLNIILPAPAPAPAAHKKEIELSIPGMDVKHGIAMTGGSEAGYLEVLAIYCKDTEDRLPLLQNIPEPDAMLSFITQVHALKSASSSIGCKNISSLAEELESAGKAGDLTLIKKKLPIFAGELSELENNIRTALQNQKSAVLSSDSSLPAVHHSLFNDLAAALESNKANDIDRILKEINDTAIQHPLNAKTSEALDQILDEVMMAEYDNAKEIIKKLLE